MSIDRHGLERFRKRLALLEEKAAKEGILYTEAQLVALEAAKRDRETNPDEIETAHLGYHFSIGVIATLPDGPLKPLKMESMSENRR
jgi:hypothetical protein